MITSERLNFLVNLIMKNLEKEIKIEDTDRFRKVLRESIIKCYERLRKVYEETAESLIKSGIREGTLEWKKRFPVEYERRVKVELRKV